MGLRVLNILTVRFGANGITAFTMNYARRLARQGVLVDLVSPNEPDARAAREIAAWGGHTFVLPQRNRNPLGYARSLAHIVQKNQYDIVHAHGNSATLFVDLLGARLGGARVRIAHSHNTSCKQRLADRLLRRAFYGSYTHAMACGQAAGRWLFGERPFTVLQNAVETETFAFSPSLRKSTRDVLAQEGFLPADAPLVCHVGTFNEQKNQAFLLRVLAALSLRLPGARLLFLGDGPLTEDVRREAERVGLADRVRFAGTIPDIAPYLSAADAFVLPSRHEGLPFTLIEAQCAGLPCFVSDRVTHEAFLCARVTALPIVETPGTEVCPKADAAVQWAEALVPALTIPVDPDARAAAGRETAQTACARGFSIARNANALLALYEACAKKACSR